MPPPPPSLSSSLHALMFIVTNQPTESVLTSEFRSLISLEAEVKPALTLLMLIWGWLTAQYFPSRSYADFRVKTERRWREVGAGVREDYSNASALTSSFGLYGNSAKVEHNTFKNISQDPAQLARFFKYRPDTLAHMLLCVDTNTSALFIFSSRGHVFHYSGTLL